MPYDFKKRIEFSKKNEKYILEKRKLEEEIARDTPMTKEEALIILNVKDMKKLKECYRKKTLEFHPDRNPNDDRAKEKFIKVKEAYDLLNMLNLQQNIVELNSPKGSVKREVTYEDLFPLTKEDHTHLFIMYYGKDGVKIQKEYASMVFEMRRKGKI